MLVWLIRAAISIIGKFTGGKSYLMILRKKVFYNLFFLSLLFTEFYYIEIGSGFARIYHFFSILVLFYLINFSPRLFKSSVFLWLLAFWAINLLAALFSDVPMQAIFSLALLTLNINIAIATALILISGKVTILSLKRIVLVVTLISVGWGFLQIIAFRTTGNILALSLEQKSQILQGFGPGFRTEANTFGKYMMVPFLLFLPEYVRSKSNRNMNLIYMAFGVGILMNFTRSSIYSLGVTILFVLGWYVLRNKFDLFIKKWILISAISLVMIAVFASGFVSVSEYALYKLDNLFVQEEIFEGSSSGFRLRAAENTLNYFLSSDKSILIGNGWGQIYMDYAGDPMQSGGGDLLISLGYGGLFSGIAYLMFMLLSLLSAMKIAKSNTNPEVTQFAEGVMFAIFYLFVVGQVVGVIIAPEYWLLVGIALYLSTMKLNRYSSF